MTKTEARSAAAMKSDLDRYRQEMGVDHIDIVLLHCVFGANWDEVNKPQMDVLSEAKDKKLIRSVGISGHSVDTMKRAPKCPWLDIFMGRINPAGARMDADTATIMPLLADLKAKGK